MRLGGWLKVHLVRMVGWLVEGSFGETGWLVEGLFGEISWLVKYPRGSLCQFKGLHSNCSRYFDYYGC